MPITNQIPSRAHVRPLRLTIKYNADKTPSGATAPTAGVRNTRGRFGSRTRSTRIPDDTITNASKEPKEPRLEATRIGRIAENNGDTKPGTIRDRVAVREFGRPRIPN